jgi:hypothetical protein
VAGVELFVALLQDDSLHVFTCRVSFSYRLILQYFYKNFKELI